MNHDDIEHTDLTPAETEVAAAALEGDDPEAELVTVAAAFTVGASIYIEAEINVAGKTPDQVESELWDKHIPRPSLCHACVHEMTLGDIDDMVELTIDGVTYVPGADGGWKRYTP